VSSGALKRSGGDGTVRSIINGVNLREGIGGAIGRPRWARDSTKKHTSHAIDQINRTHKMAKKLISQAITFT
jgi:hypothetical protein